MEWGNGILLAALHETLLTVVEAYQVLAFVSLSLALRLKWQHHNNLGLVSGSSDSSRRHIGASCGQCAPCWVAGHAHAISSGKRRHGSHPRFNPVCSSRPGDHWPLSTTETADQSRGPHDKCPESAPHARIDPFPIYQHAGGRPSSE